MASRKTSIANCQVSRIDPVPATHDPFPLLPFVQFQA